MEGITMKNVVNSNAEFRSTYARLFRWLKATIAEGNVYELDNGRAVDVMTVVYDQYGEPVEWHFDVGRGITQRFDGAEVAESEACYRVYFAQDDGWWTLNECCRMVGDEKDMSGKAWESLWAVFKEEVLAWEEEQQKLFLAANQ